MMTPRELFEVAVRVIGLVLMLYGLYDLSDFVLASLKYFTLQRTDVGMYLILGIGYLILGGYFLRGGAYVIRLAFPDHREYEQAAGDLDVGEDDESPSTGSS
jgi:hypothetical protein